MSTGSQLTGNSGVPPAGEIEQQIQRIAASGGFKHSDPIRQVLLFLARHAIEYPGQTVKEHQIATSALGRPEDFDPRVDSSVRVVVTRLRARLAEYYTHEGAGDPIAVDIPKGAYLLSFAYRQTNTRADGPTVVELPFTGKRPARSRAVQGWLAAVLAVVAAGAGAFVLGRRSATPKPPAPVAAFWDSFLRSGDPLIVFSNPIFAGAPESGMRLLEPSAFHTEGTNDTFTGTGEVMAVHMLTEQLARLGHRAQLKRARLFTWDEALANNLIIVGGPAQSSVFLQLPQLKNLVLKAPGQPPYVGEEAVRDLKNHYYLPSRRGDSGEEFAIVAMTQGASSEHSVLIVAGTNTFATEAAARFVCDPRLLSRLTEQMKASRFEALLKVEIRGGTPMEPDLVAVYPRP